VESRKEEQRLKAKSKCKTLEFFDLMLLFLLQTANCRLLTAHWSAGPYLLPTANLQLATDNYFAEANKNNAFP